MEQIEHFLNTLKDYVWGAPLLILLMGTGVYLTVVLRGVQFKYLGYAFREIFKSQKADTEGDISPFQALMTSLAGAIGTGSIVGVATAITIGGLGSMFWMWVTVFVGMATKYAESLLAVKYRSVDKRGEMSGGPMQYIEQGLGWKWMAVLFAVFGSIAAIGTGNLVQVNAIAESIGHVWHVDTWTTGIILAALTGVVLIGGVKSIGTVASILVPVMALLYVGGGMVIIALHLEAIPEALRMIFVSAFEGQAAVGGFAGASLMMAIRLGVSRSIFSNEAGLGISSIAAAAAKTDNPARQALITMAGALISTGIICSITGIVLAVTGVLGQSGADGQILNGATMAIHAFNQALPGGQYIVTVGLILFAYSTVIAWAYYGEKCFEYLFGEKAVIPYRIFFTLIVVPGAALKIELAWCLADIMNGLMVIPNLVAMICLSGVIVTETRRFTEVIAEEESLITKPAELQG